MHLKWKACPQGRVVICAQMENKKTGEGRGKFGDKFGSGTIYEEKHRVSSRFGELLEPDFKLYFI